MEHKNIIRNKTYRCLEYLPTEDQMDLYLMACGKEKCDAGVQTGPDIRDGYHLHVVLSGKGTLYVGDKEFYPHFGQMFLLKDGEEVCYIADKKDPWNYCWVTFNGIKAKHIVEQIGFTEGVYVVDSNLPVEDFYNIITRMHQKPEMNYINDLWRAGLLLEFLSLALEANTTKEKLQEYRRNMSTEDYVKKAIDFIHYNYATIHVNDIIEYIGFTRSYFTTVFKRQVGISPQKYLLQYRLKKACESLENSDDTVSQIAESVGYDNSLTFSRTFKNAYGMSPSKYREKQLQGDMRR